MKRTRAGQSMSALRKYAAAVLPRPVGQSRRRAVPRPARTPAIVLVAMAVGLLLLPSGLVKPQPAAAYKVCPDGDCNHETMAKAALSLYPAQYWNYIEDGVTEEDMKDHVYSYWGAPDPTNGSGVLTTNTHFWNADDGGPDAEGIYGSYPNAWQKAQQLWSLALGAYANGDEPRAYHLLGHVAHFPGDLTLPAHAKNDTHVAINDDDSYEEWMRDNADVSPAELAALEDEGPVQIPPSYPNKLFWLLYTTSQIADFFASDDEDGDAVDLLGLAQPKLNEMKATIDSPPVLADNLDDNDEDNLDEDGDLSVIRKYSYLQGIRAIAALYKLFEETASKRVSLGVVIDRVEEDEKHDATCPAPGCEPDFFAAVSIDGLRAQNRGEHIDNEEDVDPRWAFGNTVGTSGSVPVRVEIWDNDGKGDDFFITFSDEDDQSDVDGDGGAGDLSLELNVDVAKCLRRQPGAISGDLSGACGEALSQAGDADEAASLVRFRIVTSKSPPTADAGGPYTTNEGTNVTLDGSGSSDPDNDIATYAWDLDEDGACDDATGQKPDFTAVGQDGATTVKLCVTDAVGLTDEDTATVTVNNVAPSIELGANTPTGENTTVTLTGTISDPGWLDSLAGTISWGDGSAAQAVVGGTLENARPDATLTFSATHTYGDNGTFTAQVCARDDDTAPCTALALVVTNTAPTAVIDLSGAVTVNGTPTIIARAGASVGFSGRSTDPGSDDLTLTWAWGDGTAGASATSLVNPPNTDPAVSPTIQPRDVTSALSHTFAGACAYETTFGVTDDDGGAASQTAAVIIVGNGSPNQGAGYWKQQFRYYNSGKGQSDFAASELQCYLKIADYMSRVFDAQNDASTFLRAEDILETSQTSAILELFDQQLLAAWLNFANGAIAWNRLVDTNGDKRPDTRFLDAITAAEALRLDPNATRTELDRQKAVVLTWTTLP